MLSKREGRDCFWTVFVSKYIDVPAKIMLIYAKPLLSGQTPLSGHLPVP